MARCLNDRTSDRPWLIIAKPPRSAQQQVGETLDRTATSQRYWIESESIPHERTLVQGTQTQLYSSVSAGWRCITSWVVDEAPCMATLKTALLVLGGTLTAIVTVRAVKKRRSEDPEDEPREENAPETATEHARAAVEHTREAARKTKQGAPPVTR